MRKLFRQADIARAILGAQKAGLVISRIEIGQDGRIVILPVSCEPAEADLDNELKEFEARHGRAT